ncbi:hypothetical protein Acr_00g0045530 [Actinidia rufa]|uniref:Reverse transcriptase RNase H-like domain-containing protein n=1 Tax=Actinidia rufa TaxID=165716 RepID=A0A7J0DL15_9ERIC|nr:hypothetical protein Acr_00g0045530 [Actinidia rufa]
MANTSQAPDLDSLYREIHGMVEQIRVMNENNACLIQLLAATNPPPRPVAPPVPDIEAPAMPVIQLLSNNVPKTLSVLQNKADKYIAAKELEEAKRRRRGKDDPKRKEPKSRRPRTPPRRPELILPPLNATIAQVLTEIKYEKFVKWPEKIKTDPRKRNKNTYCEFHQDHGQNKEAELIKRGYLRKYVADRPSPDLPKRRYGANRPTTGDIQVIHGGFGSGGCSNSSRKRHARKSNTRADEEVYNLSSAVDIPPPSPSAMTILERILIDNGSLANILFILALERMKIGLDKLHPLHTPFVGFGGNMTHPLGWIKLLVTFGTEPHQVTIWQDFIVVDCPSPYNAILGRPTLGGTRTITSTYHLKMKFPTSTVWARLGETKRKFLGFLVTKRGIEANPNQIQALITMSSPRNIREESETTFQQLKEYFVSPPLLIVPATSEELLVYLSISPATVSAVLIRKEDQIQKSVYYFSKILMGAENRYLKIKKLSYALMIAARKLPHYFQAYPISVLTNQPLKQILQQPDASGRLLKWSIKLSEFYINYEPRMAIKAQALVDFVVESTHESIPEPEATPPEMETTKEQSSDDLARWMLFVDESSNQHGCGTRLVLQTLSGDQMEYAIRIGLKTTNNKAEYEALLADLRVATELRVDSLDVFSDSQLVVNQVQGDYLAKESRMVAYLDEVKPISVPLEFLASPSIGITDTILQTEGAPTWMDEIFVYLQDGTLPQDKFQARRIQYSERESGSHQSNHHKEFEGEVRKIEERIESVIPVEIGMSSFRTSNFSKENNETELRLHLDLLDEKRERAELGQAAYKSRVTKYYNQRVKHRSFLPGHLVLRKVTLSIRELNARKLGLTWEGPYKVTKVSRPGTYQLEDMNGKALPHP